MAKLFKIRDICNERKITLKALARQAGITEHGLQRILKENKARTDTLERIAKVVDVPVSYFFEDLKMVIQSADTKFEDLEKQAESVTPEFNKALGKAIKEVIHEFYKEELRSYKDRIYELELRMRDLERENRKLISEE